MKKHKAIGSRKMKTSLNKHTKAYSHAKTLISGILLGLTIYAFSKRKWTLVGMLILTNLMHNFFPNVITNTSVSFVTVILGFFKPLYYATKSAKYSLSKR